MTTHSGHTSGPWRVGELANREDGNGNDERCIELYDGGPCIGTVWPMGEDFFDKEDAPEREANARLIAAAPELLEALKESTDLTTDLTNLQCHAGICTSAECGRCSRVRRARLAIAKAEGREG